MSGSARSGLPALGRADRRLLQSRTTLVLLLLIGTTACTSSGTEECDDGRLCPSGLVCVSGVRAGCADPEQLAACEGADEGAACSALGQDAVCENGVCLAGVCGDDVLTIGELCDDGNEVAGDGCSADCQSTEICGNGILDADEECDCGAGGMIGADCDSANSDVAGASCKSDCTAHCGDGEVNDAEDCDGSPIASGCQAFGYDRGVLQCSAACGADFAECQDFGVHPTGGPGFDGALPSSIWAGADSGLALVGGGRLAAFTDSGWGTREFIGQGFGSDMYHDVHGVAADNIIAVGINTFFDGQSGGSFGQFSEWDGTQWGDKSRLPSIGTNTEVFSIWMVSAEDTVIVGGVLNDGQIWVRGAGGFAMGPSVPEVNTLRAVAGDAAGDLLAVGGGYAVWRRGGVWESAEVVTGASDLRSVALLSDGTAFAGGGNGELFRYDGTWTAVATGVTGDITSVFGSSASDLYLVADGGLLHSDGNGWMRVVGDYLQISTGTVAGNKSIIAGKHFSTYEVFEEGWRQTGIVTGSTSGSCAVAGDAAFVGNRRHLYHWKDGRFFDQSIGVLTLIEDMASVSPDVVHLLEHATFSGITTLQEYDFSGGGAPTITALWSDTGIAVANAVLSADEYAFAMNCVDCSGPTQPTVHYFSDGTLVDYPMGLAEDDRLADIGYIDGTLIVLSTDGQLLEFNGAGFTPLGSLPVPGARALWGQDGLIYVGTGAGVVWIFNGAQWESYPLSEQQILSIHGSGTDDVIATTVSSAYHFNGTHWSPFTIPDQGVYEICVTDTDLYAAFADGSLARFRRPTPW